MSSIQTTDSVGVMSQTVRTMELEDISQVAKIEREAFPWPWPATNFKRELMNNGLNRYLVVCEELPENEQTTAVPEAIGCNVRSQASQFERMRSGFVRLFRGDATEETTKQLILGFAGLWFIADEAHLANIAVRESYRQQGLGEHLLVSVIKLAMEYNARFITLEARVSNKAAQRLYGKYGFVEVGIRQGYYSDNKEDAVLMTVDDIASTTYQDDFWKLRQAFNQKWGISV